MQQSAQAVRQLLEREKAEVTAGLAEREQLIEEQMNIIGELREKMEVERREMDRKIEESQRQHQKQMGEVMEAAGNREKGELMKVNEQHQFELKQVFDKNESLLKLHEAN